MPAKAHGPCVECGFSKKYGKGLCYNCYMRKRATPGTEAHRKKREAAKVYYARPEVKAAYRENNLRHRSNPEVLAGEYLRRGKRTGNSVSNSFEEIVEYFKAKPDRCQLPICGKIGRICLDHDHKTGKVRGWLCTGCNALLGKFESEKWTNALSEWASRET